MKNLSTQLINSIVFFVFVSLPSFMFGQKLEISFYPSFHANSKVVVECTNGSCHLNFKIFNRADTLNLIWTEESIVSNKECQTLLNYFDGEHVLRDTIITGLDGINIIGRYRNETMIESFKFWTPSRGTREHEFLDECYMFLILATKSRKTKKYLKVLKQYN